MRVRVRVRVRGRVRVRARVRVREQRDVGAEVQAVRPGDRVRLSEVAVEQGAREAEHLARVRPGDNREM